MRLAFCLFKYYPFGGLERDFFRIATACVTHGHEVHVFTMHWQGELPSTFQVTQISVSAWSNHSRAFIFSQKVVPILKEQSFDVVIGFNRMPGLDLYFAADPCYRSSMHKKHGWWYQFTPRFRTYAALEKAVFSKASRSHVLLLNPKEKKNYIDCYQTPEERFHLIMPGVGEDRAPLNDRTQHRNTLREKEGVRDNELIILMVGSDFQRKGVDRALIAFSQLPPALLSMTCLWILGNGNVKAMQQLANALRILHRVTFFGARHDVVSFYAAADVLLHPAYQETAGMVLLEAMVAGLPVLVTAVCGYAEYIKRANAGVIVGDPFLQVELNEKLRQMLNPERLKRYRENALHYTLQHDFFQFEQAIIEIIEKSGANKRKLT